MQGGIQPILSLSASCIESADLVFTNLISPHFFFILVLSRNRKQEDDVVMTVGAARTRENTHRHTRTPEIMWVIHDRARTTTLKNKESLKTREKHYEREQKLVLALSLRNKTKNETVLNTVSGITRLDRTFDTLIIEGNVSVLTARNYIYYTACGVCDWPQREKQIVCFFLFFEKLRHGQQETLPILEWSKIHRRKKNVQKEENISYCFLLLLYMKGR